MDRNIETQWGQIEIGDVGGEIRMRVEDEERITVVIMSSAEAREVAETLLAFATILSR